MAEVKGIFLIQGRLGDLVYYQRNGKSYVRTYGGGFTRVSTQNHPQVKAGQERLAQVSLFVKNLKVAIHPYLKRQKDGSFHNQLMSTFMKMSLDHPESSFRDLSQELFNYHFLMGKSLNKHSLIRIEKLLYDPISRHLHLEELLAELVRSYRGLYLEVLMGWYGIKGGHPSLSAPTVSYLRIDDSEGSKLSFPATDEACEQLPFVGLAVVYTADQDSATLHAVRTVGAGFVDCRRAGDRGSFYESMCSHF